jgi:hypothetical protein
MAPAGTGRALPVIRVADYLKNGARECQIVSKLTSKLSPRLKAYSFPASRKYLAKAMGGFPPIAFARLKA